MVLLMARPTSRSSSSFLQFRKRVPTDLLAVAKGQNLVIALPAEVPGEPDLTVPVKVGREVTFSLRTKSPALAKQRNAIAVAQLERHFEALRKGPVPLSHKRIVALSGVLYREFVADWADNPGNAEEWQLMRDLNLEALEDHRSLERAFGYWVDNLLAKEGIVTDLQSRTSLLYETARVLTEAAERLRRNANGDYSQDRTVARFPEWTGAETSPADKANGRTSLTLWELFDRWKRESEPAASTIGTWKGYVRALEAHLGHDDVRRITKPDIVAWKDALVEAEYSRRGIRYGQLAAIGALLNYAAQNGLIATNPAQGVTVRQKKKAGTKMLRYEDAEVAQILVLADRETSAYRRWLPWLLAFSGARVGELAQLWGNCILEIDGIPIMKIAPAEDGGTIKNEGSERNVPIHPAILERGFLSFVRQRGDGPLFYSRARKPREGGRHASKGVTNHLAAWIRDQGFTDKRKAPNHAFRHWFKTACMNAGVQDSLADIIQCHAGDRGEADRYRHGIVVAMFEAIQRIPVPK
jgi:integrase